MLSNRPISGISADGLGGLSAQKQIKKCKVVMLVIGVIRIILTCISFVIIGVYLSGLGLKMDAILALIVAILALSFLYSLLNGGFAIKAGTTDSFSEVRWAKVAKGFAIANIIMLFSNGFKSLFSGGYINVLVGAIYILCIDVPQLWASSQVVVLHQDVPENLVITQVASLEANAQAGPYYDNDIPILDEEQHRVPIV